MRATASDRYGTFWRWHFYAGLFVLPFVLVLSFTGAIYLFKPQIDRWEERRFHEPGAAAATSVVSADDQLAAALIAYPGSRFNHYRLPERARDAAMIQLARDDGRELEVYVSPQGRVLGSLDPQSRLSEVIARLHGSLMLGQPGDWLVELAASWTIVMILTGLALWWPRPLQLAGTLWPRLNLRGRPLLKDVHRVAGFWIAGLLLVMLASGLPWAGAWGNALKWARTELGWIEGPQDWKVGADPVAAHAQHDTAATARPAAANGTTGRAGLPLSAFVAKARSEHLPFPALVLPPHAPQRFGPPTGDDWTAKSETQNRPLARSVTYDAQSGEVTGRSTFADRHVIDRVVNYGIAWHEGQLFGLANQLIGVATALALVTMSVAGVLMWLKRRPSGQLGAPVGGARPAAPTPLLWTIIVLLAILLPLFGASLAVVLLLETTVLRRTRRLARWLGLRRPDAPANG